MMDRNRQQLVPVDVQRSNRNNLVAQITSMPAGKVVPVWAGMAMREDSFLGSIKIRVEMQETREILLNGVNLRATAYAVPWLCMARFEGSREQFDNSWTGKPKIVGGTVVPFFDHDPYGAHGANKIFKYLGLHGKPTDEVNTMYVESYNVLDNYRARNRSMKLAQRLLTDTTLAPAFWDHRRFQHMVPDFDQATVDGQVPLNIVSGMLPVRVPGVTGGATFADTVIQTGTENLFVGSASPERQVFAEMVANGITVSLAGIKVAAQLQSFAKMRERYEGLDDDKLIDMLMDGLSIPDQWLKQPILLADETVQFSMAQRYATDSANMDVTAVSGAAELSMRLRCPAIPTGATIIVQVEAVPNQMFERQRDPFLHISNERDDAGQLAQLPAYVRDFMDQEKVDIVFNRDIDTDHDLPDDHFAYEPLNGRFTRFGPRAGGDYFRPEVDAPIDTIRQGLWAAEKANPTLAEDWYRVSEIHLKPFLDEEQDPFRGTVAGNIVFNGLTVFGPALIENAQNYDALVVKTSPNLIEKQEL